MRQDWNKVYVKGANEAYESFLEIVAELYEKNCPLVKKIVKPKYAEKPWITKGISKACKKKNSLYKEFLKKRTTEAEQKYKTYKNKLTKIMRHSKMDHYSNLLEDNKNNIKNTWNVLNAIIKKRSGKAEYPNSFMSPNNKTITDMASAAEEFNKFFVGVGPGLAGEIPKTGISDGVESKDIYVDETMFLRGTEEK